MAAKSKPEAETTAKPVSRAKSKAGIKAKAQTKTKAKVRAKSRPSIKDLTPYDELLQAWEGSPEFAPESVATVKDIGPLIYDSCGDDLSVELYEAEAAFLLDLMNNLNADGKPWVTIGLLKVMTSPFQSGFVAGVRWAATIRHH